MGFKRKLLAKSFYCGLGELSVVRECSVNTGQMLMCVSLLQMKRDAVVEEVIAGRGVIDFRLNKLVLAQVNRH